MPEEPEEPVSPMFDVGQYVNGRTLSGRPCNCSSHWCILISDVRLGGEQIADTADRCCRSMALYRRMAIPPSDAVSWFISLRVDGRFQEGEGGLPPMRRLVRRAR